jgi:hypothetical protein
MKFWKSFKLKTFYRTNKNDFFNGISIKKIMIFQIFNDLCVFRRWKRLKIIRGRENDGFIVMGIAQEFYDLKKELEVFFPLNLNTSIIRLECLFNLKVFQNFKIPSKIFIFNVGLIDGDSSIAYYRISKGIKKTIGPFL